MKMRLRLILFFLVILNSKLNGQIFQKFEADFNHLAKTGFLKNETDSLVKKYSQLIYAFTIDTEQDANSKNKVLLKSPLRFLLKNSDYQNSINVLLTDSADYKRELGCLLVAGSNDRNRLSLVEEISKKSNYKDFWSAAVLVTLQTQNLDPIVKTLFALKDEQSSIYLMKFFLSLDSKTLDKFFVDSIGSKNTFIRYLAIRSVAKSGLDRIKESALRELIFRQDSMKGRV